MPKKLISYFLQFYVKKKYQNRWEKLFVADSILTELIELQNDVMKVYWDSIFYPYSISYDYYGTVSILLHKILEIFLCRKYEEICDSGTWKNEARCESSYAPVSLCRGLGKIPSSYPT